MKTILLTPGDTLFFRDGRPMEGSLSGHTAAWCPPHMISHALHAAFHRAGLDSHVHYKGADGKEQKFGSLLTIGPFPVDEQNNWYFPAPSDLLKRDNSLNIGLRPIPAKNFSSLPKPLTYALGATIPPSKDANPGQWLRFDAWEKYICNAYKLSPDDFKKDSDIGSLEFSIGIGLDPETGTQDRQRIYSAQYLRLKNGWKLGAGASADDKEAGDLIQKLFPDEQHIVVGGQQRICSVETSKMEIPFPKGATDFSDGLLKWVLLSPAVFPETIRAAGIPHIKPHPGGWLPNWIDPETGKVQLRQETTRIPGESRLDWRSRVQNARPIDATLIAAKIDNPIPVSGWDLQRGAKPTQLAVPAGSVYYFQCGSPAVAKQLASVLNYPNRRSSLWGEKGYGIGVCSTFNINQ